MISHAEAQALTSARLDAALDPVAERELVTHLSTCPSCRTFAEQSNALVSGLRELPYLPASPTVSRAVHSYIGKPRSPWAKLGTIVPLQGMPAFSAIAAALLVVFFSVFVYLRVDRTGTPLDPGNDDSETTEIGGFIEAPETTATFAIVETEQAEDRATESDADSATESSDPSATVEAESSDSTEPADDAQSTSLPEEDEPTSEPESTTASDSDETDAPPEPTVTIELAEPTQTSEEDATGQGTDPEPTDETNSVLTAPTDEATASTELREQTTETPEPTDEPTETAVPTDEPTETPEPTDEPTETPEPTDGPTETAVPTEEPTETPVPTDEPTETPVPTDEPTETPVPTDEPTETPVPTDEPTETPVPTDEPTETPVPTDEPTETPVPTDEPTGTPVPTDEPTETPVPTDEPTGTPVPTEEPTETPVPTDEPTETPVPTEEPTEEDDSPGIVPIDGTFATTDEDDGSDTVPEDPTQIPEDEQATAVPTDDEVPTDPDDNVIEPIGSEDGEDNSDDQSGEPTPEQDVEEPAEPTEETIEGGDNQIQEADGSEETPEEEVTPEDETGIGGTEETEDDNLDENGDQSLSDVAVTEQFSAVSGDPSGRLAISSNGDLVLTSNLDVVSTVNGDGLSLEQTESERGVYLAICDQSGTCRSVESVDPADPSDPVVDTPIGWVTNTAIYERIQGDTVTYKSVSVDTGSFELFGSQELVSSGRDIESTSNGAFLATDGILIPGVESWVFLSPDGGSQVLGSNPFSQITMVRTGHANSQITYVGDGQLVMADIGDPGNVRAAISISLVDYDLAPSGDRFVVSTGSDIQIIDFQGNVLDSFASDNGSPLGSVLWLTSGIAYVDQGTGSINLIPVEELP